MSFISSFFTFYSSRLLLRVRGFRFSLIHDFRLAGRASSFTLAIVLVAAPPPVFACLYSPFFLLRALSTLLASIRDASNRKVCCAQLRHSLLLSFSLCWTGNHADMPVNLASGLVVF